MQSKAYQPVGSLRPAGPEGWVKGGQGYSFGLRVKSA